MNKIILVGMVGQDLESRTNQYGTIFTGSLATTNKWFDKKTNEKKEETTWHNFTLGDRFEKVVQYISKGSKIMIVGEQKHTSYTDKSGQKKIYSKVDVKEIELLDPPKPKSEDQAKKEEPIDYTDDIPF